MTIPSREISPGKWIACARCGAALEARPAGKGRQRELCTVCARARLQEAYKRSRLRRAEGIRARRGARRFGVRALDPAEAEALGRGLCPDCRSERFLQGPPEDGARNLKCAGCGSGFHLVGHLGGSAAAVRLRGPGEKA